HWHIPEAHFLEAWSDARGFDGTASIVQPLIAPLYGGKSAHEVIAALGDQPERSPYDIVRDFWRGRTATTTGAGAAPRRTGFDTAFEAAWRRWLHDGVIPNTAFAPKSVKVASGLESAIPNPQSAIATGLEISFRLDPAVLDGRFANNGWLQELPKPITKLTW